MARKNASAQRSNDVGGDSGPRRKGEDQGVAEKAAHLNVIIPMTPVQAPILSQSAGAKFAKSPRTSRPLKDGASALPWQGPEEQEAAISTLADFFTLLAEIDARRLPRNGVQP